MIVRPDSTVFTPWWYTHANASNYAVTGSGAVLGDESDATYVEFTGDPLSPVPTVTFPAVATTADLRTVFIRCAAVSGSTYIGWELRNVVTAELFTQHAAADVLVPDVVTDVEVPFDAANGLMIAALNAGNLSVTVEPMSGTGTVRIYEVWLEIDDALLIAPPLRQIGRSDGLRSVPSLHPGSRQRSLRRAGGYP